MSLEDSVTVVVTRTVRSGREAEYEAWLRGVGDAAHRFPGHLGLTIIRPPVGSRDFTFVFRFDTVEHLRDWEESDTRREWLARADVLCESAHRQQLSGMDPEGNR